MLRSWAGFCMVMHTMIVIRAVLVLLAVSLVLVRIPGFAHTKTDPVEIESPPVEPGQSEMVIKGEHEFIGRCMAIVTRLIEGMRRRTGEKLIISGKPIITKSRKFGTIFRLDLENSFLEKKGCVERIICWAAPPYKLAFSIEMGKADTLRDCELLH